MFLKTNMNSVNTAVNIKHHLLWGYDSMHVLALACLLQFLIKCNKKMCNKKMLSEHCKYFEFLHVFDKSEKELHKFYLLKICEKDFVYLAL